jgi:hypothetical protein
MHAAVLSLAGSGGVWRYGDAWRCLVMCGDVCRSGRLYALCMDLVAFGGVQMHGDAWRFLQVCMVAGRIWWSTEKCGWCSNLLYQSSVVWFLEWYDDFGRAPELRL